MLMQHETNPVTIPSFYCKILLRKKQKPLILWVVHRVQRVEDLYREEFKPCRTKSVSWVTSVWWTKCVGLVPIYCEGGTYELTEVSIRGSLSTTDMPSLARYKHVQNSAASSFIAQTLKSFFAWKFPSNSAEHDGRFWCTGPHYSQQQPYRSHNSPTMTSILSQINPLPTRPSCFFKTHLKLRSHPTGCLYRQNIT